MELKHIGENMDKSLNMKNKLRNGKLYLDHEEVYSLTFKIVLNLLTNVNRVDTIIGVEKGGYYPAKIVHELLSSERILKIANEKFGFIPSKLDFDTVWVSRYEGEKGGQIKIKRWLNSSIREKNVVIVDDVSDKGDTLNFIHKRIKKEALSLHTMTLHIKEGTSFIPDFYAGKVKNDVWIVYPWEIESFEDSFVSLLKSL